MKAPALAVLLGMAVAAGAQPGAQRSESTSVEIPGMTVRWNRGPGGVEIVLIGSTPGWVAVGFNDADAIVGSDLFMAAVQNGVAVAEHQRVVAPGVHPEVSTLGLPGALVDYDVEFNARGNTEATIVVDPANVPALSNEGEGAVWLILAYSVAPEFDHHSILRRHQRITM